MSEIIRKNGNGRYYEAVIKDGILYVAGQVGDTPDASVEQQTKELLATIDRILAENGSDKEHILAATVVLADIKNVAEMNAVWDAWVVKGAEPTRMCFEGKLVSPAWRVEVCLTAAVK